MVTRVKCLLSGMRPGCARFPEGFGNGSSFEQDGMLFIHDAACREYDWLVVYDDMPRHDVGSVKHEQEELACPPSHTILVTAEPPTIKLYPACYTRQFGYVLTTHDPLYLSHPNYRRGCGILRWMADYNRQEIYTLPEWPKSKLISTVCSAKMMKHTQHFNRMRLTRYIAQQLPELDWFGWGIRPLDMKYTALSDYKYHLAVENYIHPYHWSDKIADPILGLCLTFYAGDPLLYRSLPAESFIPIPLESPEEACDIICKAIRDGEYEKRLPAIREARRRIVSRFNFFSQIAALIRSHPSHEDTPPPLQPVKGCILGRHRLRRNFLNLISEGCQLLRFRLLQRTK